MHLHRGQQRTFTKSRRVQVLTSLPGWLVKSQVILCVLLLCGVGWRLRDPRAPQDLMLAFSSLTILLGRELKLLATDLAAFQHVQLAVALWVFTDG